MNPLHDTTKPIGGYKPDAAGLLHWQCSQVWAVRDKDAAADAIATRPAGRPCWFWFNETPAPILPDDDAATLLRRWGLFRSALQTDERNGLLAALLVTLPPRFEEPGDQGERP